LEEQLDKELRFHLEQHAAELMARGLGAAEARRQARLAIGGPEQVKESCRDARGTRWIEDLWQDVRYTLRTLRQKPSFAAVTLATLALGIGATTVMFTMVDSVLLKPLPYRDPGRLVEVAGHVDAGHFSFQFLAYPDYLDCQRASRALDTSAWVYNSATLSEPGEAEYEQQFEISSNVFSILGVSLFRGRAFLPEEDQPGGTPVAILGYSLWQRHFGANPDAVGASLVLDGRRYTIVGIAPPRFELDGEGDVYTPLGQDTAPYLKNRRAHPVRVRARLRAGATLAQAQGEIAAMGRSLAEQHPETNKGRSLFARPLRVDVSDVQSTLWLLLGAVTLVLLIACANVASLLLARAVSRQRELAMRVALGARRWRLVRQCLTESAVLGLGGGALGVAIAGAGIRPFLKFWPGDLPRAGEIQLDWRVLAFALAISLASGFLFGLAPALRVPSRAVEQTMRAGTRAVGGSRRLHSGFAIAEIALAVVLLVSAGLLGRTLLRLSALDPGVNIHNVLVTRMALSPAVLPNPARIRAEWDDVLTRARRIPGVEAIATVDTVPMREGYNFSGYWTTPNLPPDNQQPEAISTCVSPDYLKVTGIALRAGRFFTEHDHMGSQPVVVIDDVLARSAFGGQDAVGRRLWIPDLGSGAYQVIGVVAHVRYWGLAGDDQNKLRAQYYYPFAQLADRFTRRWSELMSIAVRTTVPPLGLVQPLRHELRGAANDQVLYQVRTLEQLAAASLARQRFLMTLFGIFAALSLTLACIGIYGVLAYLTSLRVPEFGVRMAMGATARDVLRLVFRQSFGMIAGGVAIGAFAALGAARLMLRLVEGMQPAEAAPVALMLSILVAAALFATFLPARRASRVDPMKALRQE
ncbi:MAG TPA: ABC transporter permease, partial [Candidatus Sulfopaludibacter sp.]|nr:ABC transporter permease [Candidatus Sulfopaludibacter sp.]